MTHRAEVLGRLLERWCELVDPVRGGGGWGSGSGVVLLAHEVGCVVRVSGDRRCSCVVRDVLEVERLLKLLRDNRDAELAHLGWCLAERFVRCRTVIQERARVVRTKGGRRGTVMVREVVTVFDSRADAESIELGLEWLAENWSLGHEPGLPAELRGVA